MFGLSVEGSLWVTITFEVRDTIGPFPNPNIPSVM